MIFKDEVDGNKIEEDVKEAISLSLIEKKKIDGKIHDTFRPVEEVRSAALDFLKQKYS